MARQPTNQVNTKMNALKANVARQKQLAMIEFAQGELQDVQRRIMTAKTDPYARRWAPWSFATRQQRNREGTAGRGLLWRTGALLRSFRAVIKGGAVSIVSDLPYAAYLQRGRANMRPRIIVDIGSKLSQNRLIKALHRNFRGK